MYTSIPVLLDLFGKDNRILHFLKLHCAIRLLIKPKLNDVEINKAQKLLESFVSDSVNIYGRNFLSYNIHCLIHLTEDVRKFGSLDHFSCFPFENNMTFFRKIIRSRTKELEQIYKRYEEKKITNKTFHVQLNSSKIITAYGSKKISENNCRLVVIENNLLLQFNQIRINNFTYSLDDKNNCCILHDGRIIIIVNILKYSDSTYRLVGKMFYKVENLYEIDQDFNSTHVDIYKYSELRQIYFDILPSDIKCKAYKMPYWKNCERYYENDISVIAAIYNDEWLH